MVKPALSSELAEHRKRVWAEVWRRDGGRCIVCDREGTDVHEIEQRSHHPKSKQLEAGTFSLENCCVLCRHHHQDIGNTRFGGIMLAYLLHARYGYPRPNIDWFET